jgi:transcriptional regulator with GAF, ATPase, and Fis domain
MRALEHSIRRVAASDATVLLLGESGTGKELVADAIHELSARRGGPLVKVSCAALVETLLLSELFGHEKGAYTGAQRRRIGRFEQAHHGTIFLDEIGDISPATQVALLRVLQERVFERVGGNAPVEIDVRVVCATHRPLARMVERGEFRQDLFYRLAGLCLEVPPLRQRLDDLPALCDILLQRIAREHGMPVKRIAPQAVDVLRRHRWPGNIRELENALRTASLFAEGRSIAAKDVVERVEVFESAQSSAAQAHEPTEAVYRAVRAGDGSLPDLKRQIERACIERALTETNGNITQAARLLGMKRPRVSQLVNGFGRAAPRE